jgi:hypothetical protein
MATITALVPVQAGAVAAFVATAPSGDQVAYVGGDLLVEFLNGDDTSITISVAPTITTGQIQGAGVATVPTRSLALAAGAHGVFRFKASEIRAYLNANKRLPFTYTTGDVLLLIRAFTLK